jgi:hypothetical protein
VDRQTDGKVSPYSNKTGEVKKEIQYEKGKGIMHDKFN